MCEHLAAHALSANFIAEQTNLTIGQIYNRLKQHDCKLRDVRDGKTGFAQTVVTEFRVVKDYGQRTKTK